MWESARYDSLFLGSLIKHFTRSIAASTLQVIHTLCAALSNVCASHVSFTVLAWSISTFSETLGAVGAHCKQNSSLQAFVRASTRFVGCIRDDKLCVGHRLGIPLNARKRDRLIFSSIGDHSGYTRLRIFWSHRWRWELQTSNPGRFTEKSRMNT